MEILLESRILLIGMQAEDRKFYQVTSLSNYLKII